MRVVCTALMLLIAVVADADAGEVTAIGVAPIEGQHVASAHKAALEDAKRAAVVQALGRYVDSRIQVGVFSLASDKIYARVSGRIDNYHIIHDEALAGSIYLHGYASLVKSTAAKTLGGGPDKSSPDLAGQLVEDVLGASVSVQQDAGVVSRSWKPNIDEDIEYYVVGRSRRGNFSEIAKPAVGDTFFEDQQARPDSG